MIYSPEKNIQQIGNFIVNNKRNKLIICLCADWCNNCNEWGKSFFALSNKYPKDCFVWLDIDQHPDMISDIDLDVLPVLLVQKDQDIIFLGAIEPIVETVIPVLNSEQSVMRTYDPGLKQFLREDFERLIDTKV
ncbi:TPA: hypothetical protein PIQ33_002753 [Klebsiella oxytoca]|nr:hypothetical protein [Klebsiella oxytoca]